MRDDLTNRLHAALEDALSAIEAVIDSSDWLDRPDVAADLSDLRSRVVTGADRYSRGIPKRTTSGAKDDALWLYARAQGATYLVHAHQTLTGWTWALHHRSDGMLLRNASPKASAWSAVADALDFLCDAHLLGELNLIVPNAAAFYVEGLHE